MKLKSTYKDIPIYWKWKNENRDGNSSDAYFFAKLYIVRIGQTAYEFDKLKDAKSKIDGEAI